VVDFLDGSRRLQRLDHPHRAAHADAEVWPSPTASGSTSTGHVVQVAYPQAGYAYRNAAMARALIVSALGDLGGPAGDPAEP
jgi:hypothetical protein